MPPSTSSRESHADDRASSSFRVPDRLLGLPVSPKGGAILLSFVLLFLALFWYLRVFLFFPNSDFVHYYPSLQALLHGSDPFIQGYVYPLFFDFLIFPLGFLPLVWATNCFRFLQLIILSAAAVWIGGEAIRALSVQDRREKTVVRLAVLVAVFGFYPTHTTIRMAQTGGVMFGFLFLLWMGMRRNREAWSGIGLAGSALVKLAPILLIPAVAAWRRRRVFLYAALVFLAYAAALFATGLLSTEWRFFTDVLPNRAGRTLGVEISFWILFVNLSAHPLDSFSPRLCADILSVLFYLAHLALGFRVWRRRLDPELLLAHGITTVLLALPILQYHHFLWALVPLTIHAMRALEQRNLAQFLVIGAVWFGLGFPEELHRSVAGLAFLRFAPTLVLLLFWIGQTIALWRQTARSPS